MLVSILIGGCETLLGDSPPADYSWFTLREPTGFGSSIQLEQRFQYQDKKSQVELTLVQSIDSKRYVMVGFGAVGGALFSAQWTGTGVNETRSPLIPDTLTAQNLLVEMQLALWSIIEVRKAIVDPNISVIEEGLERTLYYRDKPMIRITYSLLPPHRGTVEFVNLDTGSGWHLETLSYQPLTANRLLVRIYA